MREIAYRLSIAPALEPFRPEIEHACSFLDSAYFVKRSSNAERVLHYGSDAPPDAAVVPNTLFPACVGTDHRGIHPERSALVANVAALRPTATWTGDRLGYDAIGLIFLLTSRLEERDHPARDRYARFPVAAALFPPEGGRLYPWADRAALDLARGITGERDPARRTRYALKLTHDVDMLKGYHRPWEPLRWAVGDIVKRGQPHSAMTRLRRAYLSGEPWTSSRRLMAIAERHGIKNHFYFMGPSRSTMDSPYVLRNGATLRRIAGEIAARGHVLGFHPGFDTAVDPAEWQRQRKGLESQIGQSVREGRQHVLRYDAAITPRIWSDAGMALDCTLAYPEVVGFRNGTCRPHRAYDLVARQTLPLLQLSTAAMEFGLFGGKYADLPLERAVNDTRWAIDLCKEFGGTFVMLIHTGYQDARTWSWLDQALALAAPTPGVAA